MSDMFDIRPSWGWLFGGSFGYIYSRGSGALVGLEVSYNHDFDSALLGGFLDARWDTSIQGAMIVLGPQLLTEELVGFEFGLVLRLASKRRDVGVRGRLCWALVCAGGGYAGDPFFELTLLLKYPFSEARR